MIRCKECGADVPYVGKTCTACGADIIIDENDEAEARRALAALGKDKLGEEAEELYHLLADLGDIDAAFEYARLCDGRGDEGDMDRATDYYRIAADGKNATAAYKYSRLVGRHNEPLSRFYLKYSAVLGAIEAYPDASELYSSLGREDIAAYYCFLAAECSDTVSIVNMARRWYEGIGVLPSAAYAKWHLDKMTIPPISALKLAYRLRSVKAEQPVRPEFPEYEKFIKELSREALSLDADRAYFTLTEMLADLGNLNGICTLGILYAEGHGTDPDLSRAKHFLNLAMDKGNAAAAVYLAEEYASGEKFPKSAELAIEYYSRAAALGYTDANERLGDIYNEGVLAERDIKRAVEYYELAGDNASAREKADAIKAKRYEFYKNASEILIRREDADEGERFTAFRSLAIATAMGEPNSAVGLAECYAIGFGTERDAKSAFYWYGKAYGDGDMNALLPLALCYSSGFGTNRDYKAAVRYLKLAVERGIRAAEEELRRIYEAKLGKLVRRIYATGMELIHMKKYTEALSLLEKTAHLGYPKALYTLGCLYEFGVGTGKSDRARADEYYERALADGSRFGKFRDPGSAYKLKLLKMIR